ncbi:hypothetical protein V6Z11_A05G402400 [Gossypium hirsutum]
MVSCFFHVCFMGNNCQLAKKLNQGVDPCEGLTDDDIRTAIQRSSSIYTWLIRFLWIVRIRGGVFPVMKEPDYLLNGEYRIDKGVAPKMLNCLIH